MGNLFPAECLSDIKINNEPSPDGVLGVKVGGNMDVIIACRRQGGFEWAIQHRAQVFSKSQMAPLGAPIDVGYAGVDDDSGWIHDPVDMECYRMAVF